MRIDRIEIQNFKKFATWSHAFHPQFTLLVGENGAGKTTILDALSVALSVWLVKAPDPLLANSRRNILKEEVRLASLRDGERIQFQPCRPVKVTATGTVGSLSGIDWTRQITEDGKITNNAEATAALDEIASMYERDAKGENVILPVLAYYGAGRAWLPSNASSREKPKGGPALRWAAFYDCFAERIRFAELTDWFKRETIAMANREGRYRPGFEAVKRAIVRCVPEADGVWFDGDREEIVLSIKGQAQPFGNLSAGQRMMLALVADLAIKTVTQNNFLLPSDTLQSEDEPLPRVLAQTPGVVLIDELDVHLHPVWQRRVVESLRTTFPAVQFIATTHSPFVVQTAREGEVISLDHQTVPETANLGVEEIAKGLMGVERPEVSPLYAEKRAVAKHYLLKLDEAAVAPAEKLSRYLDRLAADIAPYADDPAFQAFLELKRESKLGQRLKALAEKVEPNKEA